MLQRLMPMAAAVLLCAAFAIPATSLATAAEPAFAALTGPATAAEPTLAAATSLATAAEPAFAAVTGPGTVAEPALTGRLLLPAGADGRDLSVVASVRDADGTPRDIWARVTPDGHFARPLPGELRGVRILAGIGVDLLVLAGPDLPAATATGIDLGALDLTATVVARRIVMPPGPAGVLRAAPHLGPIPTDPLGAMVSLGSAQFRELAPGIAVVWLLPPDAADIHILVEHPADARRDREWRTGRQEVFGPYPLEGVPGVLGGE